MICVEGLSRRGFEDTCIYIIFLPRLGILHPNVDVMQLVQLQVTSAVLESP